MEDLPLSSSDDAVAVVVALSLLVLFVLGFVERRRNTARLRRIPLRISVNGSRGKSTVTRLLTGALAEAGHRPLAKTTGTNATLVLGWSGREVPIARRPEGPNIGETRRVTQLAASEGADCIVVECMAIDPEYQRTFHRDLLDVNLLVICNALDDHLDAMGPTVDDVAEVFAASIPVGGAVVVIPDRHLERYRQVAAERGARLLLAEPEHVPEAALTGYDHLVLADHIALVLAITRDLDADDEVAFRGMRLAAADPAATRVTPIGEPDDPAFFVNGFAVNDPTSTLAVWQHIEEGTLPTDALTVIVNCRADRMARTVSFAADVLPRLPLDTLIVTGEQTRPILRAVEQGTITAADVLDCTGKSAQEVVAALDGQLSRRIVFGIGNFHGGGEELIAAIEARSLDPSARRGVA